MLHLLKKLLKTPNLSFFSPRSFCSSFSDVNQKKTSFKPKNDESPKFRSKNRSSKSLFMKNKEESTPLIFKPKGSNPSRDDDVHAQRMLETMKYDSADEFLQKMKKDLHKYTLDYSPDLTTLNLDDLNVINIENEETFYRVPKLAHHLDLVVQTPGIYRMSEISKLQPDQGLYLKSIPKTEDINFDRIPPYIPPSKDELLLQFAKESKIKYVMSTSTISSVLAQIYFLFSSFKNPKFDNIFEEYENEPRKFMISQRKPVTNFIRKLDEENEIYAFDSDPGIFYEKNSLLLDLGKVLERFLTLPQDVFKEALLSKEEIDPKRLDSLIPDDYHRFMKLNNDICLRSQIDCYSIDPITNKPFVFEIKTRTCCPMRYDFENYANFFDYRISEAKGLHSSYEREYYDLIRGAFLKYAFQLKIGRMDGAFLAYHNTKEIFGYEYIKSKEIMNRVFGSEIYADVCFIVCSRILTELLNKILEDLKGRKYEGLKVGFYACNFLKKLVVFVELLDEKTEWGKEKLVRINSEIKDEIDYYQKFMKLKNRIYKYDFFVYPYINGVQQKLNNFIFQNHHQIEVKYKFVNRGVPSFIDYMNFLHDAYKMDTLNLDLSYSGIWMMNK